ncbi:unnamed protein product [Cladocopium goreaui]|uniref:Uncharacterized protein n=1 Tax=Cladocopium goreaui TaxID=2562237 RepID=A0A9P1CBX7_9DINO|nr:unnamed protein product [Cladocopium goreaui]
MPHKVRNKAWFGAQKSFRSLLHDWTIQTAQKANGNTNDVQIPVVDEEEPPPDPHPNEPYTTKSELYKYFSGKGPAVMISTFLHDEMNRAAAVILCDLSAALENEYVENQNVMSSSPEYALTWAADRANSSWFGMIARTLEVLQSVELAKRLRLTLPGDTPFEFEKLPKQLVPEVEVLNLAWDFATHLVSAVFWANAMHKYRLPHASAVFLDHRQYQNAVQDVRKMVDTLLKAEEIYTNDKVSHVFLGKCLADASGMNQLLPDKDDWHIIRSEAGKDFRGSAAKFLSIQSTEMPSGVPHLDADKMNKKWAKAGVLSDERSIAAVAYLLEDYLVFRAETMIPMANHAFNSNSDWQHVSTQRLLPCMMHMELGLGTALQIVENDEDNEEYGLLKSALRAHVFILAENLKSITAKVGAKVPTFPNGSGARGSVVKADHARALIDLLFGDGETQKAKEDMINALAPPVKPKKKVAETLSQDDEIMAMIAQLDPENAAAFHRMADLANAKLSEVYKHEGAEEVKKRVREALEAEGMEDDKKMEIPVDAADAEKNAPDPTIEDKPFQGKQKKEDDDPAPAEKKPRIASTPPSLKALLPNKGNSGEVYILRNPKTFGYQFRYPTSDRIGQQSMSRKWPTSSNPDEATALIACLH